MKETKKFIIENTIYEVLVKKDKCRIQCKSCKNKLLVLIDNLKNVDNIICPTCSGKIVLNTNEYEVLDFYNLDIEENKKLYIRKEVLKNEEKLKEIHRKVLKNTDVREWLRSYLGFRRWAIKSGYKQWKILERYNNEEPYNESNCYWVIDNRVSRIEGKENKLSDTLNSIKKTHNLLVNLKSNLIQSKMELDELVISDYIGNRSVVIDIVNEINRIEKDIDNQIKNINKIKLEGEM